MRVHVSHVARTPSSTAAAARHDLVLATGHLSRDEIFAVVDAAAEQCVAGVRAAGPGRSFFSGDLGPTHNIRMFASSLPGTPLDL